MVSAVSGLNCAGGTSVLPKDRRTTIEKARDNYAKQRLVQEEIRYNDLQKKAKDGAISKSESFELGFRTAGKIAQGLLAAGQPCYIK